MPPKHNPLGLNALQLKTLTLFQELARLQAEGPVEDGPQPVIVTRIPQPHGNHFHIGAAIVNTADATGLRNSSVWAALHRKGLINGAFPVDLVVTVAGQEYDTGLTDRILHHSDH